MDLEAAAWQDFYNIKNKSIEQESDFIFRFNCSDCNLQNLFYNQTVDETVCINCGLIQYFNIHYQRNDIEYLPDTSNVIKKSVYKHRDYLNRKLDELSCARITIDSDLLSSIQHELGSKIATFENLKTILRKLGHKQKFLQIPTILNTFYPDEYPPIQLNYHQRDKLEKMFLLYIDSFFILKNKKIINRKNLLNYNFVFYKLFFYLDLKLKKHYFQLPKGKKTIENHEKIWNIILKFNKW